jgi:hypothetical protein
MSHLKFYSEFHHVTGRCRGAASSCKQQRVSWRVISPCNQFKSRKPTGSVLTSRSSQCEAIFASRGCRTGRNSSPVDEGVRRRCVRMCVAFDNGRTDVDMM